MEINVQVVLFDEEKSPQARILNAKIDESQSLKVEKKLLSVRKQIVEHLKNLREEGVIKSVFRPKNKKQQKTLDELVKAKRTIDLTIEKIRTIYKR